MTVVSQLSPLLHKMVSVAAHLEVNFLESATEVLFSCQTEIPVSECEVRSIYVYRGVMSLTSSSHSLDTIQVLHLGAVESSLVWLNLNKHSNCLFFRNWGREEVIFMLCAPLYTSKL